MAPAGMAASSAYFDLQITRVIDAPRDLVFKMWTVPEHFVRWLGPNGFSARLLAMDVRVGGALRAYIRSAQGRDFWIYGAYQEIIEPERLSFTMSWLQGKKVSPETLVSVELAETRGRTVLSLHQTPFTSSEDRDVSRSGWSQEFDKLAAYTARFGKP